MKRELRGEIKLLIQRSIERALLTRGHKLWEEKTDCKPGGRCLVFMVVEGGSINPSHWQINRADPRDRPRSAPWLSCSLSPGNHSVLLVFLSGRRVGFCLLCFTARNKNTSVAPLSLGTPYDCRVGLNMILESQKLSNNLDSLFYNSHNFFVILVEKGFNRHLMHLKTFLVVSFC